MKPNVSERISKGILQEIMAKRKETKDKAFGPVMAKIMFMVYDQFPERFLPNNDGYFKPSMQLIIDEMKIADPVYYFLMGKLVDTGWLERRKAKSGGLEYRIVFKKLDPFIRDEEEVKV